MARMDLAKLSKQSDLDSEAKGYSDDEWEVGAKLVERMIGTLGEADEAEVEGENPRCSDCPDGDAPPAAPTTTHLARFHLKSRGALSPTAGNSSWIQTAPVK